MTSVVGVHDVVSFLPCIDVSTCVLLILIILLVMSGYGGSCLHGRLGPFPGPLLTRLSISSSVMDWRNWWTLFNGFSCCFWSLRRSYGSWTIFYSFEWLYWSCMPVFLFFHVDLIWWFLLFQGLSVRALARTHAAFQLSPLSDLMSHVNIPPYAVKHCDMVMDTGQVGGGLMMMCWDSVPPSIYWSRCVLSNHVLI